ncbi:hypothetical protein DO967_12285 [Salmonella enterica subsp. salamae]|nr:hypothetical protein [Salmonella enterica subsp. salamae]ECG1230303.1 hypothetical protein [Salmonella enterica subsp. salamae]ECI3320338.1 hypothetical protein [Salmonella enterica subsp. salamae]ECS8716150.1 hypothetical protein [Salmonella enterica]
MREYESLKLRFVSVTILITETEGWQATRRYKFTNVMPVIDSETGEFHRIQQCNLVLPELKLRANYTGQNR